MKIEHSKLIIDLPPLDISLCFFGVMLYLIIGAIISKQYPKGLERRHFERTGQHIDHFTYSYLTAILVVGWFIGLPYMWIAELRIKKQYEKATVSSKK